MLFSYVCLLDLAILAIVASKPWRRLLVGSFIGTAILYTGWFADYYTKAQRPVTEIFVLVFALIFATIPLLTPLTKSRWHAGFSITLTLLPLFNAAALFLSLVAMYDTERVILTWYALGLAAAYLLLSSQFKRRAGSDPDVVRTINLLHIAIAHVGNVALPRVDLRRLRRVDVEAGDMKAGVREFDGERQSDVSQADDADARGARTDFLFQDCCGRFNG